MPLALGCPLYEAPGLLHIADRKRASTCGSAQITHSGGFSTELVAEELYRITNCRGKRPAEVAGCSSERNVSPRAATPMLRLTESYFLGKTNLVGFGPPEKAGKARKQAFLENSSHAP